MSSKIVSMSFDLKLTKIHVVSAVNGAAKLFSWPVKIVLHR